MSESASHLRDVSSTEQKPSLVGANGMRIGSGLTV